MKKKLSFLIILITLIIIGINFYSRDPVLILTDQSFISLYGSRRLWFRNVKTSIDLFRRVIPVIVHESSTPDLIAISLADTSSSPHAIIFPYRYLEAALFYNELLLNEASGLRSSEIKIFVMGERHILPFLPVNIIQTDMEQDFYRAGLLSAIYSSGNDVLIASGITLQNEFLEAFHAGLLNNGFQGSYHVLYENEDSPRFENIGCLILIGNASSFITEDISVPIILFSWMNPSFTTQNVKIIFDDSPWALAEHALKSDNSPINGQILSPSNPQLLLNRLERFTDYFKKTFLLMENFQRY